MTNGPTTTTSELLKI